jgi:hypothetical protein
MTYNLDSQGLVDNVVSLVMVTGQFEKVNAHEPKSPPGNGLTAAVWFQSVNGSSRISGMNATAANVGITVRIYQNGLMQPADLIDPVVMNATDAIFAALNGDTTMDEAVFSIDVLGIDGRMVTAKAGWVEIGGKLFRIMDITVPILVDAVWTQEQS